MEERGSEMTMENNNTGDVTAAVRSENEFDILNQAIDSGNCFLIEASAGTGKTFNIQHLYLRLILERGLEVGEILAVTFTEAATSELRTRIRNNLLAASEALDGNKIKDKTLNAILDQVKNTLPDGELRRRLRVALLSFDEAAIFTIHGFCSRMLNENAFESRISFDLELIENQDEILMDIVADFWRRNFYGKNEIFATALAICRCVPDKLLGFASLVAAKPDLKLVTQLPPEYDNIEIGDKVLQDLFDQILTEALSKLENVDNWRESEDKNITLKLRGNRELTFENKYTLINEMPCSTANTKNNLEFKSARNACIELPLTLVKCALRKFLPGELKTRKLALHLQSYDDMLLDLRSALRDKDGNQPAPECDLARRLRNRYKAAMIDEFQDTDPVQSEIFETIFRHRDSLFVMIGDPKQSIYRFRSADIFSYLATKTGKNTEERTLTNNFRSAQALLDGVNELFSGENPFLEEKIPYAGVKAAKTLGRTLILPPGEKQNPFQLDWIRDDEKKGISKTNVSENIIEWTADRIVKSLKDCRWETGGENGEAKKTEEIRPRDIAILVPINNQAVQMRTALKRRGLNAVISNSGNVFDSEMAREIYFLLRAIQNPGNTQYLKTALAGTFFSFPEKMLTNLADVDDASGDHADRLAFWADHFKEYRADWEKKGVMPMLSALTMLENLHPDRIEEKGKDWIEGNPRKRGIENLADATPALDGLDNRERNIVDMRHLTELLHLTERKQSLSPALLLIWLQQMINGSSQENDNPDAYETRLETDLEAIRIMTIHKSKGLQFPLVFCPLLWGANFSLDKNPRKKTDWTCHVKEGAKTKKTLLILPLGVAKDMHRHQGQKEALGELLRVAYVAATRAEHFCCLLYGNFSGDSAKTALNYLLKKNQRGTVFIDDNNPSVGDEPPKFESIQVFPFDKGELEYSAANPTRYEPPTGLARKFKTCELRKEFEVPKNWGIMSYSSLGQHKRIHGITTGVKGGTDEMETGQNAVAPPEKESAEEPRLPSNEKTGSCFHEIMEEIDFKLVQGDGTREWSEIPSVRELLETKMRKYGLIRGKSSEKENADPLLEKRYPLICKIIHQTLTARIPGPHGGKTFSLNEIEKSDHISEMEFFYEVRGRINTANLKEIAKSLLPKNVAAAGTESENESLDVALKGGTVNTGFMNGSIDLVFRRDGRYYFADWKTNTLEDYDSRTMWIKMFGESYILQYLIYSLTLDLYLNKRLPDYDFEKHFGGGYYLFVRGMEPDGGKGILADRITEETLTRLRKCIHDSTEGKEEVTQ